MLLLPLLWLLLLLWLLAMLDMLDMLAMPLLLWLPTKFHLCHHLVNIFNFPSLPDTDTR